MSTPLNDDTIANGDVIETIHLTQLFPIVEALEDNQTNYREDIGAADAYQVDFSGSGQANEISVYQAGQQIVFKAAHANTGASTLQVVGPSGSLSAKALTKFGNSALTAGDIQADQIVMAVYNDEGGGRFELIGVSTDLPAPEDGSGFFREDEGAADAYEVDASGGGSNPREVMALADGQVYIFKAANSNTGGATLDVIGSGGSLGAKAITKRGEALVGGDILANTMVEVIYSSEGGGRFELMGESRAEDGIGFFRDDQGAADAYELDASGGGNNPRVIRALEKGQLFTFKASQSNTGGATLEILGPGGSLGTYPITKRGDALETDDILADTMVAVLYSDEDSGRFELLGSIPAAGGGGGGGEPASFYGCQSVLLSDVQIFANSETEIAWDDDDISEGLSSSGGWIYVNRAGYYEVGLVLAMDLAYADSLVVDMQKYHSSGSGTVVRNEFDAPDGLRTFSFDPVLIYLEPGDGVRWLITSSVDDPTIKSGDLRTRCSVKLVTGVSSPVCQVSKGGGVMLSTNSETAIDFDGDEVDPNDLHSGGEWLNASDAGIYEVGLVLSMDMPAAESLEVRLIKDHSSSETMISINEMDAPAGLNMFSLSPVLVELEEGDRVKWTVTATLDTPDIRGSDFRTRCCFKYLGPSS